MGGSIGTVISTMVRDAQTTRDRSQDGRRLPRQKVVSKHADHFDQQEKSEV